MNQPVLVQVFQRVCHGQPNADAFRERQPAVALNLAAQGAGGVGRPTLDFRFPISDFRPPSGRLALTKFLSDRMEGEGG